nr:MAG TPA: hypothetical protein [Caudoviricetes sp.]
MFSRYIVRVFDSDEAISIAQFSIITNHRY